MERAVIHAVNTGILSGHGFVTLGWTKRLVLAVVGVDCHFETQFGDVTYSLQ
jgi:hypothetical protein